MNARARKDRSGAAAATASAASPAPAPGPSLGDQIPKDAQAWLLSKASLRALERAHAQVKSMEDEVSRTRSELERIAAVVDYTSPSFVNKKAALRAGLDRLQARYNDELQAIEKVVEDVEEFMAVKRAQEERDASRTTKRRRVEPSSPVSSVSPPPALSSPPRAGADTAAAETIASTSRSHGRGHSSSTAGSAAAASGKAEKPAVARRNTTTSRDAAPSISSGTGGAGGASASTPASASAAAAAAAADADKIDPAKARREALAHQLPLVKGRRVAFRQPNKAKGGGSAHAGAHNPQPAVITGDEEGETWIMAVITECINNDRNRYVVQDAEDPSTPTFNTTLKAIVPLPENVGTLPERDYAAGSHVMALYPDTSCFYRAIVKGGGPKMDNLTKKQKDKRQHELLNAKYMLEFDDDGGDIKAVPAYLVVERP